MSGEICEVCGYVIADAYAELHANEHELWNDPPKRSSNGARSRPRAPFEDPDERPRG